MRNLCKMVIESDFRHIMRIRTMAVTEAAAGVVTHPHVEEGDVPCMEE